jgi:hypothetical protein
VRTTAVVGSTTPGGLTLSWSNEHSWYTSKELHYSYCVDTPLDVRALLLSPDYDALMMRRARHLLATARQ